MHQYEDCVGCPDCILITGDPKDIFDAVFRNELDLVKEYIAAGKDVNVVRGTYQPIHLAAMGHNSLELLDTLVSAGADPNARTPTTPNADGWFTPLGLAVIRSRLESTEYLLDKCRVDVNAVAMSNGMTPLHLAVKKNASRQVVQTLLDHGASVKARDDDGQIPIHTMVETEEGEFDLKIMRLLLDQMEEVGPPKDYGQPESPLSFAIVCGRSEMVKALLDCGVDPNEAVDNLGQTGLGLAVKLRQLACAENRSANLLKDRMEVVRIICAAGADVFAPVSNKKEEGIVTSAVKADHRFSDLEMIKILLQHVRPSCTRGKISKLVDAVAVMYSSWLGSKDRKEFLQCFRGVLKAWKTSEGPPLQETREAMFVLMVCISKGYFDLLELFLEETGMDPNAMFDWNKVNENMSALGMVPGPLLHLAVFKNGGATAGDPIEAAMKWLVADKRVNLKARDSAGRTPSEVAVAVGSNRAAKLIKAHMRRRSDKNKGGKDKK